MKDDEDNILKRIYMYIANKARLIKNICVQIMKYFLVCKHEQNDGENTL